MQLTPIDLVRGEVELPSLSDVFRQFNEKLDDPGARSEDFAEIISTDPSLTVKLLKIVNSAFYSFSSNISDVSHAVTIIGLNELREMILAISVVEFFEGLPNELVSMKSFWSHSVLTGLLAKELQTLAAVKTTQSMFTAGLLHDVGSLVFYNRLPEIARAVLEKHEREDKPRYLLEREILGFDHAGIGAELMHYWELPEFLVDVVKNHHQPEKSELFSEETGVLGMTDRIARILEQNENSAAEILSSLGDQTFGINQDDLQVSIDNAKEKLQSVLMAIHPG